MPTVTIPPNPSPLSNAQNQPDLLPPSPTAPPYSPITPTISASLPTTSTEPGASQHPFNPLPAPPTDHDTPCNCVRPKAPLSAPLPSSSSPPPPQRSQQVPPPSVPISESTNPDAIALRAAMSILQLQRQQALRDMQTLESQKEKALADPEAFATMVVEGRIKARGMDRTLGPVGEVYPNVAPPARATANEEAADPDSEVEDVRQARAGEGQVFGEIPSAQNVVRMPHVNWTKYHIVGESLDKLHKEQRARPVAGQPLRDEDMRPRERAPESVIAAPYDPWKDKLAEKVKVGRRRSGGKKG